MLSSNEESNNIITGNTTIESQISYLLYFVAIFVYVCQQLATRVSSLDITSFFYGQYSKIFAVVIICLIFKEVLYTKWYISDFLYFCASVLLFTIIFASKQYSFTALPFLLFCARNLDLKVILKVALFAQLLSFAVMLIMFQIGKLPNVTSSTATNVIAFGFKYQTYLPNMFMFDVFVFFGVFKRNITFAKIITAFLINICIFEISAKTVNAFTLTTFFLVFCLGYKYNHFFRKTIWAKLFFIGTIISPILWVVTIHMYAVQSSIGFKLNNIFVNRVMLAYNGIYEYGLSLFPNSSIQMYAYNYKTVIGATYNYIDSGITKYTLLFGGIFIIMLYMLILNTEKVFLKANDVILLFVVFLMAVHFVFDEELLWLDLNPALLLFAESLGSKKNRRPEKI